MCLAPVLEVRYDIIIGSDRLFDIFSYDGDYYSQTFTFVLLTLHSHYNTIPLLISQHFCV